jgi:hypothetical protein
VQAIASISVLLVTGRQRFDFTAPGRCADAAGEEERRPAKITSGHETPSMMTDLRHKRK